MDVGDSEDGAFRTAFLRSLKARRLGGVQWVVADVHPSLRQAVNAVLIDACVQRCRAHFTRNMLAAVRRATRSRPCRSAHRRAKPHNRRSGVCIQRLLAAVINVVSTNTSALPTNPPSRSWDDKTTSFRI
jgi:Transposase, Mutator family